MAKLVGELLFRIAWDFAGRETIAFLDRISLKAGLWANTKMTRRIGLTVGLLLGLAAWGFWPLMDYLLAH